MAYAEVSDLEARWRTLTAAERERAETLLVDAAVRIDAACPPPEGMQLHHYRARIIVSCDMVKRSMSASGEPGVNQLSQTHGPFTRQFTYSNPTGDLYLTKADRKLLGCGRQRASSVSLISGPDE